ncbi:MAG: choice-of-anchor tandem repeat GloVer-containing protein [Candidatus Cybelea sp.]
MLHAFNCYSDGTHPYAGLIVVKGALYGTTEGGGTFGYGTVFRMSTGGLEKVLYSFAAGSDGAERLAAVTLSQRQLLRHHFRRWQFNTLRRDV